jgi:aminopeptidase Y
MVRNLVLLSLSSLAASSAIQYPLIQKADSGTLVKKPLVSSKAIQHDIKKDALLERAKHLSTLADLSLEEYGHPTRVIGSKGNKNRLSHRIQVLTSQRAHRYH